MIYLNCSAYFDTDLGDYVVFALTPNDNSNNAKFISEVFQNTQENNLFVPYAITYSKNKKLFALGFKDEETGDCIPLHSDRSKKYNGDICIELLILDYEYVNTNLNVESIVSHLEEYYLNNSTLITVEHTSTDVYADIHKLYSNTTIPDEVISVPTSQEDKEEKTDVRSASFDDTPGQIDNFDTPLESNAHTTLGMNTTQNTQQQTTHNRILTYGSTSIDGNVYVNIAEERISNFILKPEICIEMEHGNRFKASIITEDNKQIPVEFDSDIFNSKGSFRKAFSNYPVIYTGSDLDLQNIKMLFLLETYITLKGVKYVGIHKVENSYYFTDNDATIDKNGMNVKDVVLSSTQGIIKTNLSHTLPIDKNGLDLIRDSLFRFNSLKNTASIIGYVCACFFREQFLELDINVPHLLIFGEAGSGKTQTTEKVIKSIFGLGKNSSTCADQITSFTNMLLCGSSNILPFIIEEYKPSKFDNKTNNAISALLRDSYNRFSGNRGTSTQTIKKYDYTNPIILIGEEIILETAVQERSIELIFGKSDINDSTKKNFEILATNKNTLNALGKTILLFALGTDCADVGKIYDDLVDRINKKDCLPYRVSGNVAVLCTGLALFEKILQNYSMTIQDFVGITSDELIDTLISAKCDTVKEENLDGLSAVERTIDLIGKMIVDGSLTKGVDYILRDTTDGKEGIALRLHSIFIKMNRYHKNLYGSNVVVLNKGTFEKQIKRTRYFNTCSVQVRFSDKPNGLLSVQERPYILYKDVLREKFAYIFECWKIINYYGDKDDYLEQYTNEELDGFYIHEKYWGKYPGHVVDTASPITTVLTVPTIPPMPTTGLNMSNTNQSNKETESNEETELGDESKGDNVTVALDGYEPHQNQYSDSDVLESIACSSTATDNLGDSNL